jgi:hypothetical protein
MKPIHIFLSRCTALFRGKDLDDDLDEELRAYPVTIRERAIRV